MPPPSDIWPSATDRFADVEYFRRVDLRRYRLAPADKDSPSRRWQKLGLVTGATVAGALATAAAAVAAGMSGNGDSGFPIFMLVVFIIVIFAIRKFSRGRAKPALACPTCGRSGLRRLGAGKNDKGQHFSRVNCGGCSSDFWYSPVTGFMTVGVGAALLINEVADADRDGDGDSGGAVGCGSGCSGCGGGCGS